MAQGTRAEEENLGARKDQESVTGYGAEDYWYRGLFLVLATKIINFMAATTPNIPKRQLGRAKSSKYFLKSLVFCSSVLLEEYSILTQSS